MQEQYYEKLLNIKTSGEQKWNSKTTHYHPYEPTSYSALETLFQQYKVESDDYIIDFGCGKGRLIFYINHFFKSEVTGIEMNNEFYEDAMDNKSSYLKKHKKITDKINFLCCFAQDYNIKPIDNKFYFFNPFSIQIFMKVIENILDSVEKHNRKVELILYYPTDDYIYYLENSTSFVLKDEIILPDVNKNDANEKFLIYELNYL
jgi:SAM-dependent methyltransferase